MERFGAKISKHFILYYFKESKLATQFKGMKLTETDIKNVLYGSIRELTKNRTYYYDSSYRPHWTDEGKRVVSEMLDLYAEKITQAIKEADEQRSKDLVLNALKEESK
jgi:hypothetical protein